MIGVVLVVAFKVRILYKCKQYFQIQFFKMDNSVNTLAFNHFFTVLSFVKCGYTELFQEHIFPALVGKTYYQSTTKLGSLKIDNIYLLVNEQNLLKCSLN